MTASSGYAIIPTSLARSAAVSAQAKAVYIALTSHRGEETITAEQLAKEVGTTTDVVVRALKALHRRGWGDLLAASAPTVVVGEDKPRGQVFR